MRAGRRSLAGSSRPFGTRATSSSPRPARRTPEVSLDEPSLSLAEASHLLGISEEAVGGLAQHDGRVPLKALREYVGTTTLELARELAHAREEAGRLSGQLREVRATNLRLQKEIKEGVEERRRLTEEVLELRAAAEEIGRASCRERV